MLHLGLALPATICCICGMTFTAKQIAEAAGVTPAYARMILNGSRSPSRAAALRAYDALGCKIGPLAGLDDSEIDVVRKMERNA